VADEVHHARPRWKVCVGGAGGGGGGGGGQRGGLRGRGGELQHLVVFQPPQGVGCGAEQQVADRELHRYVTLLQGGGGARASPAL
jgi:hypothetical protein